MALKRRQFHIRQYKFTDVKDDNGVLTFPSDAAIEHQNSENILYETLYRLLNKTYDTSEGAKNTLPELFILNANSIDEKDDDQVLRYKKIMSDGVDIDNIHYIRFGKSSSMAMNQRTLFVCSDLHTKLKETITLGKQPNETVISKYETAIGLTLSSINLVKDLPRICIVKDFETSLVADVKVVSKFELREEDQEEYQVFAKLEQEEVARKEAFVEKWDEIKESRDFLSNTPLYVGENAKSKSAWEREGRRVKVEELDKPEGHKVIKKENKRYPVYKEEQTEEIPNIISKFNVGYDVKLLENHENEITPFDGQGFISFEYARKLSKKLKLKYTSNAFQIRMPYIKGLMITYDLKSWFKEKEVTHIIDLWDNLIDITNLDIIMTESCFKAKLEALGEDVKQKWLFSNMDEYMKLIENYGHRYIGIANYAKSAKLTDLYTPLTYQFINSLDIDYEKLTALNTDIAQLYLDILHHGDVASVKAFLNMIKHEGNEEDVFHTDIAKAIDINERMIFDPRVQVFLRRQILRSFKELAIGRVPVKGDYKFVTGDCVALAEWITYNDKEKVVGFLQSDEFYCNGKSGQYVMMRNPLTSWHEVKKANFVSSNNRYVEHLNNVIQFNAGKDLTMAQLSGCDFDGDKVLLTNEPLIYESVIEDFVIVNIDDKTTANAKPYNLDSIIEFELKNLSNETALVTNIGTYFQTLALEEGNLRDRELEIATCKQLQAEFIDSVKKGTNPTIPAILLEVANKKPFFQKFIYGGEEYKYLKIKSPLNRLAMSLDKWLKKQEEKKVFITEYLDIDTMELITDMSKVDQKSFFELTKKIAPIYNDYAKAKGELWKEEKQINKLRMSDKERDQLEHINKQYKDLYEKTRKKCVAVCDNESVLATICTYIEYRYSKQSSENSKLVSRTKSYIFPWIMAPEGIMENLKTHEDEIKVDIVEVPQLNGLEKEYEGIVSVVNCSASIDDVQFETKLADGNYRLFNQIGYHFIDYDHQRKTNVETLSSDVIKKTNEESSIEPLKNYKCRLLGNITDGYSVSERINHQIISLNMNGNYLGIYLGNEYICGIAQESYTNLEKKIMLENYIGQSFKVSVEKINTKSLTVYLNSL
ncbi:hypothetical protein CD30_13020 [Ureibacillus massiliensis 4400831 = CIP 108448 = CCUG 49529]|uniref:RDRP core domain-containing protein n=1 Tax=Ureibacillus massiliensis 4400831 = CIP 108448 = CCUG 49529 TaxID=1211035 RepID=A0A0A3JT18_9BACL|nr:hypothetical protein [Ureibacillus massiliensis]KGR90167.1 hypothetical protein CD30_13020 [Ureibacillus massiliensis 4400831 = CIP 108448 = CCUG 49529]